MTFLALAGLIGFLCLGGKVTPTSRTFLAFAFPIGLFAFGFVWPFFQTLAMVYNGLFIILLIADRFLLSKPHNRITVARSFPEKLSIGQENSVILTLTNMSNTPLSGRIWDASPPEMQKIDGEQTFNLPPDSQGSITYTLIPSQRGLFQFEKTYLKTQSRLGLLWLHHTQSQSQAIKVYPNLKRLKSLRVRYSKSVQSGMLKRRFGLEGSLFEGLQTYLPGDDIKKIDWRATARLDVPIVRQFTSEVDQPILLLLDGGRKMQSRIGNLTKLDWALNALFALSGVALDQGDQVGVGIFDQQVHWMASPRAGKKQLHQIIEHCYNLQGTSVEPDYEAVMLQFASRLKRRSCIVIFTDLIDPWVSRSLMKSIQVFVPHHLVIILTFSDPAIKAIENATPNTIEEAYEKGVALDLNQLRQRSLKTLQQGRGVVIIDAPPQSLDEKLIAQYISMKLRQKL